MSQPTVSIRARTLQEACPDFFLRLSSKPTGLGEIQPLDRHISLRRRIQPTPFSLPHWDAYLAIRCAPSRHTCHCFSQDESSPMSNTSCNLTSVLVLHCLWLYVMSHFDSRCTSRIRTILHCTSRSNDKDYTPSFGKNIVARG